MKTLNWMLAAVLSSLVIVSGCGGGGGGGKSSGNNTPPPENTVLSGAVLNNHTDLSAAGRAVSGARVVLVRAADLEGDPSVSPLEDRASSDANYPAVLTGSNGHYQFTTDDFSDAYPADGTYFVYVVPPASSTYLLPGGSASRESLTLLGGGSATQLDITLSDSSGPNAAYIGTIFCLFCHPDKKDITHTLHFVGIRQIGPNGTIADNLMDLTDTSVYDLSKNNNQMLAKFTNPATRYPLSDDSTKSVWLGKDSTGYYFQLTATSQPKYYIHYSYGNETGLWRGLFMTTVEAGTGTYATQHGANGSDYAYFVFAPFQYNEAAGSIHGGAFVSYHADQWDFDGTGNGGFTADVAQNSFDLACAGCHGASAVTTQNPGQPTQRRVAVFPKDDNGYSIDGTPSEINIGCEKCHGPGYNHLAAGGNGHYIISPDLLPPGRLTLLCGACHIRGQNHTDIAGGVPLKADGNGYYETFRPGQSPALFFGTSDGTGKKVAPFGTSEVSALTGSGYLAPVDFDTDTDASWRDLPFGAVVNHSKSSQQQYADFVRSPLFQNSRELLTCTSCHDAHGSSNAHMLVDRADNNAVCLPCHSGAGRLLPHVDEGMIDRLSRNVPSGADKTAIGQDVETHIFNETGTLQMAPYDPEGTGMGRCTGCHMPRTARSADWSEALATRLNQYQVGDISSHTFDAMATEAVNAMVSERGATDTTPAGITDVCGTCHVYVGLY
jgi:predicted CXXCH cytochrome family protein